MRSVFSNANDFLIAPDDIEWLSGILGDENVTFHPRGGQMGDLHLPDVQDEVMGSLADLLL